MITTRRVVISMLLAVAFAGFFYAFTRPTEFQQPAIRDEAVKFVSPAPGELVLRQTEVAVDLAADYTGVLTVDEHRIPEDQHARTVGLNRVAFTPGDGKELEELSPGRRCASVELWQVTLPDAPHRTYTWCFEVH